MSIKKSNKKVSIVMGSQSDFKTMKLCKKILEKLKIKHEIKIISAHRTPYRMFQFAKKSEKSNVAVIIAGAGGSAHLPGMIASNTTLPVIGIPIPTTHLEGTDSLLSIVQMPKGIPVATFAIGEPGAVNSALYVISLLAIHDSNMEKKLAKYRTDQTNKVLKMKLEK